LHLLNSLLWFLKSHHATTAPFAMRHLSDSPLPMPRYVALLRGVNVGRGNKVPMAEFRAALAQLGCADVITLLNSGNAVFSSSSRSPAKLAAPIGEALQARCAVSTPVIVKSAAEFASIVLGNPFLPEEPEHSRFLVAVSMDQSHLKPLKAIQPLLQPSERLAITAQAAYLHCPGGISKSKAAEALLCKAARNVTTRNWATTLKIAALLD
jgi:uncharacterized protein (DUF1697 family)